MHPPGRSRRPRPAPRRRSPPAIGRTRQATIGRPPRPPATAPVWPAGSPAGLAASAAARTTARPGTRIGQAVAARGGRGRRRPRAGRRPHVRRRGPVPDRTAGGDARLPQVIPRSRNPRPAAPLAPSVPIPSIGPTIPVGQHAGIRRRRAQRPPGLHRQPHGRRGHRRRHRGEPGDGHDPGSRGPSAVPGVLPRRPHASTSASGTTNARSPPSACSTRRRTRSSPRSRCGPGPYLAAVTPDGTQLYVPNHDSGTVSVIDTATNAVTSEIRWRPTRTGSSSRRTARAPTSPTTSRTSCPSSTRRTTPSWPRSPSRRARTASRCTRRGRWSRTSTTTPRR